AGALKHLKWAIDCCAAMGAETLLGPYHQPLGEFTGDGPSSDEKNWAADVHRDAAQYAQDAGVLCAIEYLNRFECYFLTTMADAVEHVRRVDHPNFGTMYDTFHANIEEKDPVGIIAPNIGAINHVHISENDRGTPGKGHIDFPAAIGALKSAGYDSWLTVEAFGRALPDLAAATRVWRDFFPNPEEVYTDGFKLIRDCWN
ncbi:MAG: sugar phosphate isomerase/epimerase, partial [Phycisphaerae bacterium]|nr:sugar phosphate isomerase/epimerase [Phycisphaerae bacterium]